MSDLISRQAALDALARTAREKFNLSNEYNHYLAGLMDVELAIKELPAIQHVATDTNVGDTISRQAAIDAIEKMNIPEDMCVFEILSHIEVEIATLPTIQPEERTEERTEMHACDLISRQAAVELVMKYCPDDDGAVQCDGDIRRLLDELENLPPTQSEPKEGYWIEGGIYRELIECNYSECGQLMTTVATVRMNYCPNCGARMVKGGEPDV